jgi:hypothetical protein
VLYVHFLFLHKKFWNNLALRDMALMWFTIIMSSSNAFFRLVCIFLTNDCLWSTQWLNKMLPEFWYGLLSLPFSCHWSGSICTHIDMGLPVDFMLFRVGVKNIKNVFTCSIAFKRFAAQ